MANESFSVPEPYNEPIKDYAPGSEEKEALKKVLAFQRKYPIEMPIIIGGQEIKTYNRVEVKSPHDHSASLGFYHKANKQHIDMAVDAALLARRKWYEMPWEHRVSVFLKAADLLSGKWRNVVNAVTMLGQSKTVFQSEIDAVCELCDFWRFNAHCMKEIMSDQPRSTKEVWNRCEYRSLEGFVFAVSPFNFTSIAGNLATAPAMVGNSVVWKPASTSVYSSYYIMKLLEAAGLPPGVINFVPGSGSELGERALTHPDLAGVHFTGSTEVFKGMWKTVGENIHRMNNYPRIVGETGGKDFIFVHKSADLKAVITAAIRGAFEYQGQKCSAASRMYIPKHMWYAFRSWYRSEVAKIKVGPVEDFRNFMSAVIDQASFDKIVSYIEYAKSHSDAGLLTGGDYDDSKGYFIDPTTIVTTDPFFRTMKEEIFGPVLTIYLYEDDELDSILKACANTSQYRLTGAIFAQNRDAIVKMSDALRDAAGNFYINDKPTGAVVGQQPFGGARGSGTNDKAGSKLNLLRWMSVRTIKETMVPPEDWRYPFMEDK
jgi:1-pyrroline-5-carboxylate dehydrogenase